MEWKDEWTHEACMEGWGLFVTGDKDKPEIQRIDEPKIGEVPVFDSDNEALGFVLSEARHGNVKSFVALTLTGQIDILKYLV